LTRVARALVGLVGLLLTVPATLLGQSDPGVPAPPEPPVETIGAPAAFGAAALSEERVAVPAGSALRERPHPRSPAVTTIDADSELPLVERAGGWVRVRYGARKGWVLLDPSAGGGAVRGRGPRAADPALLAKAVARLGSSAAAAEPAGAAGPWALYTDLDPVSHQDLLHFVDRIASQIRGVYRERYGADGAEGGGSESVVLFAREADYRAFAESDAALSGLEEGGFAGFGVAALYAEGRSRSELASLLVHELTHLENARRFGPDTPPWLEEGLANDLGYARIGPGGVLDPAGLGGGEEIRGWSRGAGRGDPSTPDRGRIEITVSTLGARAGLDRLVGALRRRELLPLADLTALGWHEITDPSLRALAYAESGFFVRFLLDPSGGRAEAFRGYLRSIAAGGPAGADSLLDALGEEWSDLEPDFHRWLVTRAR
jgi:hypothetical protein